MWWSLRRMSQSAIRRIFNFPYNSLSCSFGLPFIMSAENEYLKNEANVLFNKFKKVTNVSKSDIIAESSLTQWRSNYCNHKKTFEKKTVNSEFSEAQYLNKLRHYLFYINKSFWKLNRSKSNLISEYAMNVNWWTY